MKNLKRKITIGQNFLIVSMMCIVLQHLKLQKRDRKDQAKM